MQRRLLLDPEYTNDAVKSFSLTDIDGSFTADVTGGGCGAVIVSAAPTLYSSACGFQSGASLYYAYVQRLTMITNSIVRMERIPLSCYRWLPSLSPHHHRGPL